MNRFREWEDEFALQERVKNLYLETTVEGLSIDETKPRPPTQKPGTGPAHVGRRSPLPPERWRKTSSPAVAAATTTAGRKKRHCAYVQFGGSTLHHACPVCNSNKECHSAYAHVS
ncbi:hypothetical protein HAX54_002733 [Datura stramonium]|uniref:Uncharacterized protein n=1 Tax=Datura stramonium TaxID=4076 RepID=A0ABS8T5H8_DATST|nr:hypothetical protein [Datura stramonium]